MAEELNSMPGSATSVVSDADEGVSHSSNGSQSNNSVSAKQAEIETLKSLSSDLEKKASLSPPLSKLIHIIFSRL